ncbi:MAG TPA: pyridoxal phosphate-dependent aminotransferase [Nocardioides sp.]|uniref:pyridoxal phosphate-dependent aminotransferase n=1 Tax=uncultured Nocardioides sp. TaxID=198441 RepID=UPI000ECD0EE6|nr:pyridoxal phosphate-dependent aminotransferase [uncultured Nocardioides sp.]HCB06082.1 putative succinyldiaminopimelate transaminase DapC [Nocardioides sp.]HRD62756.1 pyridoxal phosphate-dependent aminotransferase [Nocardioides sp.]HRI95925.1 pyridoxal phosphate-dependent aminotransferase [Nocardioides sp.]HRK45779.1 pyridoxal phosphate-dependent aminotransferase [Nocardioides sp.]
MTTLATRLQGIAPTIFTEMSALAVRTGSVNLGQGFPDQDGPPEVIAEAVRALEHGANQYAPGPGRPELRQAIARHQQRNYGLELDPDREVVVTTGCTEGIAAALLGLVEPGDEVVVLEPYYDSYLAMIQMAGGVRRPVTLREPDFRLDVDALRAAVTDRTRFVLLNSPHNPTGTVLTREELQAVADLALEHDLVVITDEVYEHLTFGVEHVPIATLPGMFERTLTLSSAGKSYSFTGWKVGWATGPPELVGAVLAAKQWLTFTSGSPLQPAVALALDEAPDFPRALGRDLQDRRDLLLKGLAGTGLAAYSPQGTYFASASVRDLGWPDGMSFCLALPERAGVVAIPTQVFYDDPADPAGGRHLVRFAFCKDREVIEEGLARLAAADLRA